MRHLPTSPSLRLDLSKHSRNGEGDPSLRGKLDHRLLYWMMLGMLSPQEETAPHSICFPCEIISLPK